MLNWGIVGTGRIAATFARALHAGESGRPLKVYGRNPERTAAFAAANGIGEFTNSLEELLGDRRIGAVYIATPHPFHAELSIRALEAGKPVLCEKPMTVAPGDAARVVETARRCGKLFMEGYMYRWHPQTAKLVELLRAGSVGEVNLIESAFGFACEYNPADRLFDPEQGGGAIWDIGGYPLSMAMLAASAALGCVPESPFEFAGSGVPAPTGADLTGCATARWQGKVVARIAASCGATLDAALRIHGSQGRIVVANPWVCDRNSPEEGVIRIERRSGEETLRIPAVRTSLGYEGDGFARLLEQGASDAPFPAVSHAESVLLNETLCRWRAGAVTL